jgi:hypothetical protein
MPARRTRLRTTVAALLLPLLFAPGNLAATPSSGFYNATAAGGSFLTVRTILCVAYAAPLREWRRPPRWIPR